MDKVDILANLDNPRQLEKLYRGNKTTFKSEFSLLYPEITDRKLAAFWNERLNYEGSEISWGSRTELAFVILASLAAGVLAKFPELFNLNPEVFYQRNIGFIIFPLLTTYFIWKNGLSIKKIFLAFAVFLVSLIFINFFPDNQRSDTLLLSCIHLPLLLWSVLGFAYAGAHAWSYSKRIEYLRYNGDLIIMTGLILIAGALFSGLTIGLFSVIGFNIEKTYQDYVVVFGIAAAPIVGTYLTQTNPQLVNKVSPVIARIFSPLVLVTLVIYLVAILVAGKDPYNDRDFLVLFNGLLIGVMALILFSVAETFKTKTNRTFSGILFALSLLTIIVNGIALSAILFRIFEWGITPNRLAVLGGNILMLANLLVVTFRLFRSVSQKGDIREVENSISMFLPVYIGWTIVVIFFFPLLFQFR